MRAWLSRAYFEYTIYSFKAVNTIIIILGKFFYLIFFKFISSIFSVFVYNDLYLNTFRKSQAVDIFQSSGTANGRVTVTLDRETNVSDVLTSSLTNAFSTGNIDLAYQVQYLYYDVLRCKSLYRQIPKHKKDVNFEIIRWCNLS